MLELVRIDAIPNLALKKPARHQLLLPERIWREPIFSQPDVRAPPSYRDKSSVRPIALQVAQELVDRHYRLARWRSAPDRDRRRHPTLPEGVKQ
jgi:hypothetical protein